MVNSLTVLRKEKKKRTRTERRRSKISKYCASLTVFGDPDSLGLVFADAQQHNDGVEGWGNLYLLQQVIDRLDLLPAWTQQHRYGLNTNTSLHQNHSAVK